MTSVLLSACVYSFTTIAVFFSPTRQQGIEKKSKVPAPFAKQALNQHQRGPRTGSLGITYSEGSSAPRVDPPPFTDLRIYMVTADGKSFTVHGYNKSGFTLALASDDTLVDGGNGATFHPRVTFADQFKDGTKSVGKVEDSGNVWVARGPTQDFWVSSDSGSITPPVLPTDGKSVTVLPRTLKPGKEALWLNFQTDNAEGVSFLIVGGPSNQAKPDMRDVLAKETAALFLKALTVKKDINEVMKTLDVPFIFHGKQNIKDRNTLRSKMEQFVKRAQQSKDSGELKVEKIYSIAEFPEKLKLRESYRKLLHEALAKTDRVIIYRVITNPPRDDRAAIFVRIRAGKAKVVGID